MRLLITGLNGTLAPVVVRYARAQGDTVVGWDRTRTPPDDAHASARFVDDLQPDGILHLAMGDEAWAARLAAHARAHGLPFVFTSTAMVFHHEPDGPHRPGDLRTAQDEYGRYKIRCEDAVRATHPDATIARIGWQIDPDARGNNMLAHLDAQQAREGRIDASRVWTPACSFMADTAAALHTLVRRAAPGVHHLDSNAAEAHSFDRVVQALRHTFERTSWQLHPTDAYRHDQRLVGHEALMPPLSVRLPALR